MTETHQFWRYNLTINRAAKSGQNRRFFGDFDHMNMIIRTADSKRDISLQFRIFFIHSYSTARVVKKVMSKSLTSILLFYGYKLLYWPISKFFSRRGNSSRRASFSSIIFLIFSIVTD
jgi:hypothetical protein